ncbi:MAG: hypothetical protein ABIT71_12640 [Vicinamibacteraceae bacterium]
MIGRLAIERAGRVETIDLDDYGAGAIADEAAGRANAWIKSLRHVEVAGRSLRDRFHYRGDSLWWFAELFLHKEGVVDALWRAALTLDAVCEVDEPTRIGIVDGGTALRHLVPQVAARLGIGLLPGTDTGRGAGPPRDAATGVKSRVLTWAAEARRALPGRRPTLQTGGTLAFVHSAFWRDATGEEGYIAPVLDALAATSAAPIQLVGVGPRHNFQARRWWHPLMPGWRQPRGDGAVVPVETLASHGALAGSRAVWRARHEVANALIGSAAMRAAARVAGYDAWDVIAPELRGIATLQFPWSVRAMDEARAAITQARPRLVLTYAEAGGWGRAIMTEARRHGIPCAGIQHGFIYRRWLNYLHERDEMQPSATMAHDAGFPRPDLTVVFDRVASLHLEIAGAFPRAALAVTGSPGLERLAARVRAIGAAERSTARVALGLADGDRAAVVVAKHVQLGRWLPLLVAANDQVAAAGAGRTRLIVKPHPAETPDLYAAAIDGSDTARLAPPSLDLATLLVACDLVVTVNSTVAIDAMALGIPALSVGVPNNLTPFVVAGGIAGVYRPDDLPSTLARLLQNDAARAELVARGLACAESGGIRTDDGAAVRAAEALAALADAGSGPAGASRPAPL